MTDPFALASALPVPIPVERRDSGLNGLSTLANGDSGELLGGSPPGRSPSRRLQRMSSSLREQLDTKGPVAPYQALPVQGPIEDNHAAVNVPILEPNGMPQEVGALSHLLHMHAHCRHPGNSVQDCLQFGKRCRGDLDGSQS